MSTQTSTDPESRADAAEAAPATRVARVRISEIVEETAEARSFVVEPLAGMTKTDYRPGQFLTVRVPDIGTGSARCYSLSSSPHTDPAMKFTVKRVAGGHGSNWLCDTVRIGDELDVLAPAGTFVRPPSTRPWSWWQAAAESRRSSRSRNRSCSAARATWS
ncbi:FAD-binding oxidoreductase [Nocardia sp. NRRL WC-3656]|uniref:FAD-binding oxidoreductase n=1 Tax=Nocardia sp. NRRL WC-3656 TaxID=1463824 RepID=UPI000A8AEC8C